MRKNLIAISSAIALSGCALTAIDQNESRVTDKVSEAESHLKAAVKPAASQVAFSEGSYIPLRRLERGEYSQSQVKTLNLEIEVNRNFQNLNEIASWLTSITSQPVSLGPELLAQAPMAAGSVQPFPSMAAQPSGVQSSNGATASRPLSVTYSGSVKGFLDIVAANYGIFWKLQDQSIRLLLTDSRTFRIKALPGETQLSSNIGSTSSSSTAASGATGGAGTSNGTSSNNAGISFTGLSVWAGIEAGIKQLLTPLTGKVAVSPATGTVSVSDTPQVLDRVAEYVKEQNASLSRQVAVNVRVLSVSLNEGENYGINWDAVYQNISENAVFKVASAFPTATGAANFVLQTATPSSNNWGAASGAIISALSTQGKVSELTSATVVTMNNQPAPVNVGRQVSYLASSSTTVTASAGSTTSLTPGQVQTGFSMVLVPHIIDGKELLMQSSVNLSSLIKLSTVTSGGASIQSPDMSTSNFIQRVRMTSGDTLVVAGFDQDNLSAVSNGVGAAKNNFLGSQEATGKRTLLVVLIQPTVSN